MRVRSGSEGDSGGGKIGDGGETGAGDLGGGERDGSIEKGRRWRDREEECNKWKSGDGESGSG